MVDSTHSPALSAFVVARSALGALGLFANAVTAM